jgi:hypothetical protein
MQEHASSREEEKKVFLVRQIEIHPEAVRRTQGHEELVKKICNVAEEEAQRCGISLLSIRVRPSWSHESNEQTSIVIDAAVKATSDERNHYWDAVCEQMSQLESSLPSVESDFLSNEIFFIVSRD